jgi:hypothetical protein
MTNNCTSNFQNRNTGHQGSDVDDHRTLARTVHDTGILRLSDADVLDVAISKYIRFYKVPLDTAPAKLKDIPKLCKWKAAISCTLTLVRASMAFVCDLAVDSIESVRIPLTWTAESVYWWVQHEMVHPLENLAVSVVCAHTFDN